MVGALVLGGLVFVSLTFRVGLKIIEDEDDLKMTMI